MPVKDSNLWKTASSPALKSYIIQSKCVCCVWRLKPEPDDNDFFCQMQHFDCRHVRGLVNNTIQLQFSSATFHFHNYAHRLHLECNANLYLSNSDLAILNHKAISSYTCTNVLFIWDIQSIYMGYAQLSPPADHDTVDWGSATIRPIRVIQLSDP